MGLLGKLQLSLVSSLLCAGCYSSSPSNDSQYRIATENDIDELRNIFSKMEGWKYDKLDLFEHWQTPSETERRKKGDCEDFSLYIIEKLREKGIRAEDRIGYIEGHLGFHFWVYMPIEDTYIIIESVKRVDYSAGSDSAKKYHEIPFNFLYWLKKADYNMSLEKERMK